MTPTRESTLHAPLAMDEPSEPVAFAVALEPAAEAASKPRRASSGDQIDPESPHLRRRGRGPAGPAAALRDWLELPGELGRSDASMRALHTFRGGARLAGAMRLGELAPPAPNQVSKPCCAGAGHADVQALQDQADALGYSFEQLGRSLNGAAPRLPRRHL